MVKIKNIYTKDMAWGDTLLKVGETVDLELDEMLVKALVKRKKIEVVIEKAKIKTIKKEDKENGNTMVRTESDS